MCKNLKIIVFVLFITITQQIHAFPPSPPPVNISIVNIPQETSVWCWAAVSEQIIAYLKGKYNTPSQCALVALSSGSHPQAACNMHGNFNGNMMFYRTGLIPEIQNLIYHFGGHPSSYALPTNYMNLYNELKQGHPIIMQIKSGLNTRHVIVIRGMQFVPTSYGFEPVLLINDPMNYYTTPVPFTQLAPLWIDAIVVR